MRSSAAARYLHAAGGSQDIERAVYAYNHADWYVDEVMDRAHRIAANAQFERASTNRKGTISVFFDTGRTVRTHSGHQRPLRVRYRGGVMSHFDRLIAAANMVSAADFPYLWGGGHEEPARFGPFDCSGAVSYVMQQAGYTVPTTVAGDVGSSWRFPTGPGKVTIFYNETHTFMRIGGRYFGTSGFARPGGGAPAGSMSTSCPRTTSTSSTRSTCPDSAAIRLPRPADWPSSRCIASKPVPTCCCARPTASAALARSAPMSSAASGPEMSLTASRRPVSVDGIGGATARLAVAWPTLVTAAWLSMLVLAALAQGHWNPYVFVQFDHRWASLLPIPHGAPLYSSGFDGQLYWQQARDPLLLHHATIAELARTFPGYHLQRVAYPALAWLLAAGDDALLPWTMLGINVAAVLGTTFAFSLYARDKGWNPAWALAVGLMPGFLMPVLRDLSDVLAMACMFGALLAWERGRAWLTGALIAVAALSREPMALAILAIAIDLAGRGYRARSDRSQVRAIIRHGWPAIVIPVAAFLGWQQYIHTLHAPLAAAAEAPVLPPFNDFLITARAVIDQHQLGPTIWVLAFFVLTLAGLIVAFANLRFGTSAATLSSPRCWA